MISDLKGTVREIVKDKILKAVISRMVIALPFLGMPVINPIFVFLMKYIIKKFYKEAETFGSFMVIDFKIEGQRKEYNIAKNKLKEVLKESSNSTEEEKNEAKEKFKNNLSRLIRF